jgi:hypothetical protein
MNVIVKGLMIRGLKYSLKYLRNYMATEDFIKTADEVLDRIEDYYSQGSLKDTVIEEITGEIRYYFDIPDGDK